MISKYSELLPALRVDLPHASDPLIMQYLQMAGRDFCLKTEAWTERLTFNVVDSKNAYTIAYNAAIANGMSPAAAQVAGKQAQKLARQYLIRPDYEADVIRPSQIWTQGNETEPEFDQRGIWFYPSTSMLEFKQDLQVYTPTATNWATGISYVPGQYVIEGMSRYLCSIAHTAGTFSADLAAFKWQLMPNDIILRAVLLPRVFCNELAAWFMEKWAQGIIARTMWYLVSMKNKDWSSPERVAFFDAEYNRQVNLALRERFTGNTGLDTSFNAPTWTN